MNRKTLISLLLLTGAALSFASCNGNKARLGGRFIGAQNQKVTLEMVSPAGKGTIDTITTDSKGNYRFTVKLPSQQATLYNLKVNGETIPLFISPGEKISVNSLFDSPKSYTVEGSEESVLLKEITDILRDGTARLDSLARTQARFESNAQEKDRNTREFVLEYQSIKRDHIKFIVTNKGKLAAIYALNQRLPNDEVLFAGDNDIVYYRTVAEETAKNYPGSPYVTALQKIVDQYASSIDFMHEVEKKMENPDTLPQIELPDIYGNMQKLSDRIGKVILLDFWSVGFEQAAIVNAEYRELYNEFKDKGFDIFQVNVDNSRPEWVNAVQTQKLPWTTLFDTKGTGALAARMYNVSSVPANYLIDAGGEIVGRDLFGEDLTKAVAREVRKINR